MLPIVPRVSLCVICVGVRASREQGGAAMVVMVVMVVMVGSSFAPVILIFPRLQLFPTYDFGLELLHALRFAASCP